MVKQRLINWDLPLRRVKTGEVVFVVGHAYEKGWRKVSPNPQYGSGGLWYNSFGEPVNHPGGPLENYDPHESIFEEERQVLSPAEQREADRLQDELAKNPIFGDWS